MALVIEDGSVVPGANSWINHEQAALYLSSIGLQGWPEEEAEGEKLLLRAMSVIVPKYSGKWRGEIVSDLQSLPWPRKHFHDDDDRWYYRGVVLTAVKELQAEVAISFIHNPEYDKPERRGIVIESKKVGPITKSTQYDGKTSQVPTNPRVARIVRQLLDGGTGRVEIHRS